ncbi:hypothetical protein [Jejuia pallidilutea]|jgi:hypothetical protein|uniref:Uncharacterized protein n=1 Tax=Jejuia pallidilutea TaxID=504487 RepID=A0A090VMT8_9FLAO|nr:hypothetical protein [Jejuia pallidilutea]PQV49619.1 hypothetical protein CLV33_103257 [Jejuia pallidilutea]GAL65343.1 hypothetical protein JCM19301_3803 [Jejuia pallidilutea]GAL69405.1 hypothetical protein JCM19302_4134 [Jejuia pallidilutea]GAL89083.1 hypothetical protein JCM19538_2072 [Jejuia pallidilutea]
MKKVIFTLAIAFISVGVFAQQRSDLKGPAYKNYKPGLHKSEPVVIYAEVNKTKLTGPEYKNQKPWKDTSDKVYVPIVYGSERSKLKGPAYKNYKPWKKNRI